MYIVCTDQINSLINPTPDSFNRKRKNIVVNYKTYRHVHRYVQHLKMFSLSVKCEVRTTIHYLFGKKKLTQFILYSYDIMINLWMSTGHKLVHKMFLIVSIVFRRIYFCAVFKHKIRYKCSTELGRILAVVYYWLSVLYQFVHHVNL